MPRRRGKDAGKGAERGTPAKPPGSQQFKTQRADNSAAQKRLDRDPAAIERDDDKT